MPAVQKLLYVIYSLLYLCCHAMCFYSRYMQKVCEVLTTLPLLAPPAPSFFRLQGAGKFWFEQQGGLRGGRSRCAYCINKELTH